MMWVQMNWETDWSLFFGSDVNFCGWLGPTTQSANLPTNQLTKFWKCFIETFCLAVSWFLNCQLLIENLLKTYSVNNSQYTFIQILTFSGWKLQHLVPHPEHKLLLIRNIPQVPERSMEFSTFQWAGLLKHLRQMLIASAPMEEGMSLLAISNICFVVVVVFVPPGIKRKLQLVILVKTGALIL